MFSEELPQAKISSPYAGFFKVLIRTVKKGGLFAWGKRNISHSWMVQQTNLIGRVAVYIWVLFFWDILFIRSSDFVNLKSESMGSRQKKYRDTKAAHEADRCDSSVGERSI